MQTSRPLDVDEKDFELTQIGIGICVPKGEDKDIVVAAARLEALGLHLSLVEKKVLDTIEAEMAEGRIIARTPTFALFRSPADDGRRPQRAPQSQLELRILRRKDDRKTQVGLWTSALESKAVPAPRNMVRLGSSNPFSIAASTCSRPNSSG